MKKLKKQFLKDVLKFNEEEIKLIIEAQEKFPELLTEEDQIIKSAKNLYEQVGLDKSNWAKWYKKNIINNEFFKEGQDWKVLVLGTTTEKGGQIGQDFEISLEFAKHLVMQVRNENGHKFRSYFILMEKAVRGLVNHEEVRHPERKGYKEMCSVLTKKFYILYPTQKMDRTIFQDNADMLNIALLGVKAKEIKEKLGYEDNNTREHLEIQVNKALYELQMLNSSLILADVNFAQREDIIQNTCKFKYNKLKMDCYKEIAS